MQSKEFKSSEDVLKGVDITKIVFDEFVGEQENIFKDAEVKLISYEDYLQGMDTFMVDMVHGFCLGVNGESVYFYNKDGIKSLVAEEYDAEKALKKYFHGPIVLTTRNLAFVAPKLIMNCIEKVADTCEANDLELPKDFPYVGEVLSLKTMFSIESALPLRDKLNGWNHFIVVLENLIKKDGTKFFYFEGKDHYCFLSKDDVMLHYNEEELKFTWEFAVDMKGMKVSKKTLINFVAIHARNMKGKV